MAEPPYRINERRRWAGGARNNLFEAATPTRQRRRIPRTDNDTKSSVSDYGWRELLSGSRFLFSNFGPIRGAIFQMANYAVGCGFNVQYRGANRAWGEQMEEAIAQHDKICDIRGGNYDFRSALILDLVSIIRDGDTGFLLTETENGYPLYQSIASHRLASGRDGSSGEVTSGRFSGFSICHGVIQNAFGRPVGYRICDEGAPDEFTDIPADSFGQFYRPEFSDQPRGIPWLSSAINDIADIFDVRQFTKTGLKGVASRIFIETNEAGAQLDTNPLSGGPVARDDHATPTVERLEEGTMLYFRANSGSKVEVPNDQRPSSNSQDFMFDVLRGAFEALGWPIEFYNPEALGGANIRLRVAQAMRTLEQLQELADKIARRKHLYAIAKLIKGGVLPPDADWWKIEHQMPRNITVDNGRDTKADLQALESGAMTFAEWFGRNGEDWQEQIVQKITEREFLETECKARGIDPDRIIPPAQRGGAPGQQQQQETNDDEEVPKNKRRA